MLVEGYAERAYAVPNDHPVVFGLEGPKDLTSEEYREYVGPNGTVYRIDNPVSLYYREGGSTHRIVDREDIVHCIAYPSGYNGALIALRWKNKNINKPVNF